MTGIAAVGVDDDFAAGETRISLRASHHEFACGIHQILGGFPTGFQRQICGGWLDNMGPEVLGDPVANALFIADAVDFRGVLGGNKDRIDGHRFVVFINNAHLGFAIGKQIVQAAVMANFSQPAREPVGQADRQRHQFRGFVAGVAEHDSLVSSPHQIQRIAGVVIGLVHTLSDIRRLLVESDQHSTAIGVESTGTGAAVSDLLDHVAHQVDKVHLCF